MCVRVSVRLQSARHRRLAMAPQPVTCAYRGIIKKVKTCAHRRAVELVVGLVYRGTYVMDGIGKEKEEKNKGRRGGARVRS